VRQVENESRQVGMKFEA